MRLAWLTGTASLDLLETLKRHGVSRPATNQAGRRAPRRRAEKHKTRQAGTTVVIGVLDDLSRLTYSSCGQRRTRPP